MGDTAYSTTAPPFLPYLNLQQGIHIDYPANWVKQEQNAPAGFILLFCSPRADYRDEFSENLNLVIEPLAPGISLDQYFRGTMAGFAQTPLRFIEEGAPATLGGYPAYRVMMTGPLQTAMGAPLSGKYLQLITVYNSRGYVLTYTAEMQKYDAYLPLVEHMIGSFEIR